MKKLLYLIVVFVLYSLRTFSMFDPSVTIRLSCNKAKQLNAKSVEVTFYYSKVSPRSHTTSDMEKLVVPLKDNYAIVNLEKVPNIAYCSIKLLSDSSYFSPNDVNDFLIEPGDNLDISFIVISGKRDSIQTKFNGRGSEKNILYSKVKLMHFDQDVPLSIFDSNFVYIKNNIWDSWIARTIGQVDVSRNLSKISTSLIISDIFYFKRGQKLKVFKKLILKRSASKKMILDLMAQSDSCERIIIGGRILDSIYSVGFAENFVEQQILNTAFDNIGINMEKVFLNVCDSIHILLSGNVRDRCFADLFHTYKSLISDVDLFAIKMAPYILGEHYKNFMKLIANKYNNLIGDFDFQNMERKTVRLSNYSNKFLFLDFWFTGCSPCASYYQTVIKKLKFHFRDNPRIKFVAISVDNNYDLWIKSVATGTYTDTSSINLYTGGLGQSHPFLKIMSVTAFPFPLLVDPSGRLVKFENGSTLRNYELALKDISQRVNSYFSSN